MSERIRGSRQRKKHNSDAETIVLRIGLLSGREGGEQFMHQKCNSKNLLAGNLYLGRMVCQQGTFTISLADFTLQRVGGSLTGISFADGDVLSRVHAVQRFRLAIRPSNADPVYALG